MSKSFIITLLSILVMTSALIAEPVLINHQGRLTDATGSPVNGLVELTFSLCAAPPPGCVVELGNGDWTETHSVDVADGLFSVILGSITPLDFSSFDVPVNSLWIQIQAGTDTPLSPTTRLTSVPMAAVASALQGEISTNNGVLAITDSLGDTSLVMQTRYVELAVINNPARTRLQAGSLSMTDSLGDTTISILSDTGGVSLSFNKVDMVDDAELLALIELEKSTGASITLRRLDTDDDDDGILTLEVDNTGSAALYMNKGELIDAMCCYIASAAIVVDTSKAQLQLSKVDAGNALNAFASNTSVGIIIIDSTLDDSGLIGLQINDIGPNLKMSKDQDNGDGTTSRIEFAVLPSRIELARTDPGGGSLTQSITIDMEKFVRASIDPADPDSTFVLNFANREMSLRTPVGPGLIPSRVEIADLDVDGILDLRVDGNIGVGTSTPSEKLHVIGNICATGTIGVCSDERFKQDIDPISGAIEKINQLQGVNYSWKRDEFPNMKFSDERQIGFIAQEIKEILPSIVSKGADGYYTVDYSKLTPVLVEAIKEQQQQIDSQQKQIDELKKLVQQLANRSNTNKSIYGMK